MAKAPLLSKSATRLHAVSLRGGRTGMPPRAAYRYFYAGRTVATVGSAMMPILLTFAVLRSGGNATTLASVLTIQIASQLSITLVAGVLVDRWNRRNYLLCCQILTAANCAAFATLVAYDLHLPASLLVVAGLSGILSGLAGPSLQSILPQLVDEDELQKRTADLRIMLNIVQTAGPVIAGMLISFVSIPVVSFVLALLYMVSAVLYIGLPSGLKPSKKEPLISDVRRGWSLFWATTWFVQPVIVCGIINTLWAGFFQLLGPVYAEGHLGGARSWGTIAASLSLGLICGGFIFRRIVFEDKLLASYLSLAGKMLPIVAIGLQFPLYIICIATFLTGCFVECFAINFYTYVQKNINTLELGRLLSYDVFVGLAMTPVGYWLAARVSGSSQASHSIAFVTASAGIALLVATLVILSQKVRSNRGESVG